MLMGNLMISHGSWNTPILGCDTLLPRFVPHEVLLGSNAEFAQKVLVLWASGRGLPEDRMVLEVELMDDVDNRGSPLDIRWWIRALQVRNEDVEGKVFLLENMSAVAEERPPCNLPDRCWYYTCGHL